tara:strand:- start:1 stop:252 length:252 start_codon:yes stop_codon:yes gene_type:complete
MWVDRTDKSSASPQTISGMIGSSNNGCMYPWMRTKGQHIAFSSIVSTKEITRDVDSTDTRISSHILHEVSYLQACTDIIRPRI